MVVGCVGGRRIHNSISVIVQKCNIESTFLYPRTPFPPGRGANLEVAFDALISPPYMEVLV